MKKKKDLLDHLQPEKIRPPSEAYFKTLAQKVSVEERHSAVKNRRFIKITGFALAAAAVLFMAFVLFNDFSKPTKELKVEQDLFYDVNDEEIYTYVNEHIDDFTIDELSIPLGDESIEEDFYLTDISQDEIISYIEAENIDLDEFEDELLIF